MKRIKFGFIALAALLLASCSSRNANLQPPVADMKVPIIERN